MAENGKLKALVVDDETVVRDFLVRFLSLQPVEVKAVEGGQEAIDAMKQEKFDMVFLDLRMPRMGGIEAYSELKKLDPHFTCVFMTGYAIEEGVLDIGKQPGTICLKKPFEDIGKIKEIVNKLSQAPRAAKDIPGAFCERRAYARFEARLEVGYRHKAIQEGLSHCLSKNISLGGIRIVTADEMHVGTELDMIITDTSRNKSCNASGRIIWYKKAQGTPGNYDTGIMFTSVNLEELAALIAPYRK